jgi:hypothetical protein
MAATRTCGVAPHEDGRDGHARIVVVGGMRVDAFRVWTISNMGALTEEEATGALG